MSEKRSWRDFWRELDLAALGQVSEQLKKLGWRIEGAGPPWVAVKGSWPRLIAPDPIELARRVQKHEAGAEDFDSEGL